jgi:hypothetical protein
MEVRVPGVLVFEDRVNCLECQYLNRPNPAEDSFVCLRNLERVTRELDEPFGCDGFEELKIYWTPQYVERVGTYV